MIFQAIDCIQKQLNPAIINAVAGDISDILTAGAKSSGFVNQFVNMLATLSPHIIDISTIEIPSNNTLLFQLDFKNPPKSLPPLDPAGKKNTKVEAIVLRPGEQKFEHQWVTDGAFRNLLRKPARAILSLDCPPGSFGYC